MLACLLVAGLSCRSRKEDIRIRTGDPEVVSFKVLPFSLDQVKLLDGPFKHALELNIGVLLRYEPDRLLAKFRSEADLEPKAEHYGGWENDTIAGHSLGHYLSGCALMFASTGDERFLKRVGYIVDELVLCQEAGKDGYIGAIPNGKRILAEEVAKGDIRASGFSLNGLWAPYYVHHKVIKGLLDAYTLCHIEKALSAASRFADWIDTVVSPLDDGQIQKMLICEHGGMNEVLAEIYGLTGEEKYLRLSRVFHHKDILEPLAEGQDILPGKHGNTQIPKLIGLARRYELTGDERDRKAAEFFWNTVVDHHSYVTGGHGNHEYFGQPDKLRDRLSDETTESCNVYNMMKLSRHLFQWEAAAKAADFYERALFNHILSAQHPNDGRIIYNLSLEMGGFKFYQDPIWFTCCIGTGMEVHSKYGRSIFFRNDEELFVFQHIASELDWPEKGVTVRQETAYPEEQGSSFAISCEEPVRFTLQVRYPYWAEKGIGIKVNGEAWKAAGKPGSFIAIEREWTDEDRVEVCFPFSLRLEAMPDDPRRIAVLYGPLVLAGDLGPVEDPGIEDPMVAPVIMTEERDPSKWLEPVDGEFNTFMMTNVGRPCDVVLKPFYKTHERRYSVYWDMHTEATLKAREEAEKAELGGSGDSKPCQ